MSFAKCLARLSFIVGFVFLIGGPGIAQNAVPMLISSQGELRSPTTGEAVPDDDYDMTFFLYDVQFGGTPLWEGGYTSTNGNAIQVRDGTFTVMLGSGTGDPLSASLFNGSDRWLEIVVEGETLEPRQRLTSVPYSIVSENSRLLDGRESSDFAGASHIHSGGDIANGIVAETWIDPTITRDSELSSHAAESAAHHQKTTSFADLTDAATEAQIPPQIARDAEIMPAVLAGDGSGSGLDADRLDGLDSSDLLSSSNDYGRFAVASDLYEMTETLMSKYVNVAGPDAVTGSSSDPMLYVTNSGTGYGLSAYAESSYAIRGRSEGDAGYGVYGLCHGSDGYGVVGSSGGANGSGVWGDAGGENGRGVKGIATNSGPVVNYGGWFEARGAAGRGASCIATGTEGIGVYAEGNRAGVYSQGDVEVNGDVEVTGDLVVTGAYRGSIGPNNGAPFPRPAYDSGWQVAGHSAPLRLDHNLGGNPDDYVVDLQFRDQSWGVHHKGYGGLVEGPVISFRGAWWQNLTEESIEVKRGADDDIAESIRVRIWVYN